MAEEKIKGGYYIKARKIQDSKIATAPPHVREIWDWLLKEANHKPKKYAGFVVERGQLFRSYMEIREGLHWMVGWRKMMYNENQTKKAMKFLREGGMIDTKKELGGVLITICNYDYYQTPENYERTNESTNERTIEEPLKNQTIPYNNKNDKNDKNKEKIYKKEKFNFKTELLNLGVEPKIISDWLEVRRKKKAANTETAFNRLKTEIEKSGLPANECIKIAAERSWQGFNHNWLNNFNPLDTRTQPDMKTFNGKF